MDSHYDQVMKARAQNQGGSRLYFAYSTALDRAAFNEWRMQHGYGFFTLPEGKLAEGLDLVLVYDFPSRWWGGRVAGLADQPGSSIFGTLIEIPAQDWPIIQHKEGAVTGMCVEREVRVRSEGRELSATAFTTRPERATGEGPVSASFVEALLRGAEAAGLPESYLDTIRGSAR
jgi:hypothetical protein